MNDIPEPAKKIQRLMFPIIVVGVIGALALGVAELLSPDDEADCPDGEIIDGKCIAP